ncbi:phosphatidylglycerophosphate synthase [Pseudoroseicyclus aestuarii]|uniref:Phosphatidylglycerophosphate synthase n=1 Tax=Pseudoroseicyclus aestuarii TaxID=1795041 RepID=A0A318T3Q0_9RHOB|nr:phosphatidylglycerophosphate synthase [Pseudoroseicyclus aestuarii]
MIGLGLCLAIPTLVLAWTISPAGMPASLAVLALGLGLAVPGLARGHRHERLGGANAVTTLRLALVAAIAASAFVPAPQTGWAGWAPTALAALALSLDAVDGWLARRQGLSSAFGARYDMEVDSALAAILAMVLLLRGVAGAELLVLGGARYAFVAAAWRWPWLGQPLPESLRRKTVCVVQIAALLALAAPVFPAGLAGLVAPVAALLVAWSFGVDIRWLARRA